MSIMDHDPKYAKLLAWREQFRQQMIDEYHRYIKKCMLPPPALLRWVQQDRAMRDSLWLHLHDHLEARYAL